MVDAMDRDGVKTVLPKGAIGYDDYAPGGDTGRVYIGTGTANIPLAKKDETSTKLINSTAAIGVTVGLSGDYTTLRAAIDYMCTTYSDNRPAGFKAYILLQSDFTLNEQIVLSNSELGWITITSNGVNIITTAQSINTPVPKTIYAEGVEHGTYNINTPTIDLFSNYGIGYGSCFVIIGGVAPTFWNITFEADASWGGGVYLFTLFQTTAKFYGVNTLGIPSERMQFMFSESSYVTIRKCSIDAKSAAKGIYSYGGEVTIENSMVKTKISCVGARLLIVSSVLFLDCVGKYLGINAQNSTVTIASSSIYEQGTITLFISDGSNAFVTATTLYSVVGGDMSIWVVANGGASINFTGVLNLNFSARAVTNSSTSIILAQSMSKILMLTKPLITGAEPTLSNGATFYKVSEFSNIIIDPAETRTLNIVANTVTTSGIIIK